MKETFFRKQAASIVLAFIFLAQSVAPNGMATQRQIQTKSENSTNNRVVSDLSAIPDRRLREAAVELLNVTNRYVPPKSGDGDTTLALEMCLKGRKVYSLFERHQIRLGEKSAKRIRPLILDLYKSALEKISWVNQRQTQNGYLPEVYNSIFTKHAVLSKGLIPPAPLEPTPVVPRPLVPDRGTLK